jgi:hypothetical protein
MDIVPAEGYTPSDHRASIQHTRIPTAPTAMTRGRIKPRKMAHFQAVDKRAVFVMAVGTVL